MGTAQAHVLNIYEKVRKATPVEPHELIARFRASSGDDEKLREYMNENAGRMRAAGYSAHARTTRNKDGSIDAEMRIGVYDVDSIETVDEAEGEFRMCVLAFGDETEWPREV